MRRLLGILAIIALAVLAYLVFAVFVPYGGAGARVVEVHPRDSSFVIASELERGGAIRSRFAFLAYHAVTRQKLKAGAYLFDHAESTVEVYHHLAHGDMYAKTVTIPEGYNMFDIAQTLEKSGIGNAQQFLNEARTDTQLVSDISPSATSLEGYLFPDTYRFAANASMRDIAMTMVKRFRQESQAIGLAQRGADIPQLVTLASFVEKETAVAEERPLVAGVFYNRLRDHIALATDPSVIYASELAGTWHGVIHQSELHSDSEYNTYTHAGLTPGPICNPGASALQAAMNPAQTDYLYFVADGGNQGHHRFARNLEEHNHNVSLYRQGR